MGKMMVMESPPMMCGGVMESTSDLTKAQDAADKWRSKVEQDLGKTFTEYKVISQATQSTWPQKWYIRVQTDQGKYSIYFEDGDELDLVSVANMNGEEPVCFFPFLTEELVNVEEKLEK